MAEDWQILHGDCRELLAGLPADSVDEVVTDPPYELAFMGKSWDASGVAFQPETWLHVLRVLKPGGHLLAFGGTRTYHRMTCAIEDAGFEIRDCLQWIYGSGFPKSLDVSKAIDASIAGTSQKGQPPNRTVYLPDHHAAKRGGSNPNPNTNRHLQDKYSAHCEAIRITAPATPAAQQWQGWGTALKPAYEPIVLARKPLVGTVAQNVQQYGTGAINVDGCRVEATDGKSARAGHSHKQSPVTVFGPTRMHAEPDGLGRWPANILHDGSEGVVALFPQAGGGISTRGASSRIYGGGKGYTAATGEVVGFGDSGSAARFFYTAKASRSERGEGNTHPTVKPLALMRYLVRLITPPGGLVLDPFTGSGTTGIAALREGFRFIGMEQSEEYAKLAEKRIRDMAELPLEQGA